MIRCSAVLLALASMNIAAAAEDDEKEERPTPAAEQGETGSLDGTGSTPTVRAVIDVVGHLPELPAVSVIESEQLQRLPAMDGGQLLRIAPGVSSGRMGGHGLDPRVRGLGEGGIRVLLDGAEIHGGCPNRMDPPSSYAAVESYDRVTVVRGVQTLRYGTAVGTVLFERESPASRSDSWWRASANVAGGTFNDGPALGLHAAFGTPRFSLELSGDRFNMESYKDGDGEVVRSAFDSRSASIALGWTPDQRTSVRLAYEANRTRDALYAGAGMDSPFSDNDTVRLRFRRAAGEGLLGEMAADLYWSEVAHLMDNYSLRELTAPMAMQAPSTSDSKGGRFWSELVTSDRLALTLGLDLSGNSREALRFAGPNPETVEMLQSVLWPDVDIVQNGFLIEGEYSLGNASLVRAGIRGDRHEASASAADLQPAGMNRSPRQLWNAYYGDVDDAWDHTNVSGYARFEGRVTDPELGLFVGLSRTAQAADTTQRYMSANSGNSAMRWVGNPGLDVAVHTQLDAGLSWASSRADLELTAFYDRVDDEILRDRAHGQEGILQDDNATIYRNVDAVRTGFELVGGWRSGGGMSIGGDVAYVWAQNTTDDRPIAQTPPLGGQLFATWSGSAWGVTGTVRWAARQTRVDDDPRTGSGLDAGETPGWAALDLSASWLVGAGFRVVGGVDNVFDRTYAEHLNRDDFFNPIRIQINEPGRTFWLRVAWSGGN